jgi:hypothetical protein
MAAHREANAGGTNIHRRIAMNIRWKPIASTIASLVVASGVTLAAESTTGNMQGQGTEHRDGMDMNRMQGGMTGRDGTMGSMMGDGMGGGMTGDGMGGGMMGNGAGSGMMGNGMDGGMMAMMGACGQMMNARGSMSGMPKLPPGNEKLQLQMQAEMMQKMGEILSSYAARIPDTPQRTR